MSRGADQKRSLNSAHLIVFAISVNLFAENAKYLHHANIHHGWMNVYHGYNICMYKYMHHVFNHHAYMHHAHMHPAYRNHGFMHHGYVHHGYVHHGYVHHGYVHHGYMHH